MTTEHTAAPSKKLVWLGTCRAGFERDLAQELARRLDSPPRPTVENCGYVLLDKKTASTGFPTSVADCTFARQLALTDEAIVALTNNDRVTPILSALLTFMDAFRIAQVVDCVVEYPDTNDGKALSRSAKAIAPRLNELLGEHQRLVGHAKYRAYVFLTPDKLARVGIADVNLSASEPLGIPRFRMPAEAPSRSTLKLAEAIHVFLGPNQDKLLQPEMRAVDLGAAPGGWTWQLVERGIKVIAVDNGSLKGDLVDNAMVKHMRMDGFRYSPNVPVDWLVCDIVEQPVRIARLVAQWLANGWARYAIFNLKLPMKKRFEEVARCREVIESAMEEAGKPLVLQMKQLYHDREEVTGYATVPSRREQFAHNRAGKKPIAVPPKKIAASTTPARHQAKTTAQGMPRGAASPWSVKPLPRRKKT
jgi:23S rRNA (cytidine2498-2'-O)-methyltransferase